MVDLPLGESLFGFGAGVGLRFLSTEFQLVGSRFNQGNFFFVPGLNHVLPGVAH